MGMMESFKFLLNSRYVRDLATLVVAYGISINLVEVTWNSKLKEHVIYVRSYVLWKHNSCSYKIHNMHNNMCSSKTDCLTEH